MSERAKIHLGDIQCECLKRSMDCEKGGVVCDYRPICHAIKNEMPLVWDLRDPPRFNEAQMALLKVFYDRGFRKVITGSTTDALVDCIRLFLGVGENETLDLAELLGKDGAEC